MWCIRVITVIVLIVCSCASEDDSQHQQQQSDRSEYKRSLNKDCSKHYSTTCLKLDIVSWVDKLNEDKNYDILPGVSIVRENASETTADIVTDLAREFPNDPDARLDAFLLRKLQGYLNNHSVKVSLFSKDNAVTGRGKGGGGGGGKKGGGMGMIMAVAAMMKGTMMALALGALAAISGKALMTAMISLLLSGIVGLKSLSGGGGGKSTYEVIAKPIISHSHSASHEDYQHGHSGYGRSFDMPLPLALQPEYKPE